MKDVYIHYGSTHFRPEAFIEPENTGWVKPAGGLWASLKNNDKAFTWKKWCESEDFHECDEENSFSFTLKDDAKVHYIYGISDLLALPGYYLIPAEPLSDFLIDFEKCLEDGIDAIELRNCFELHWNLYGWDCDCILILNPDCIEKEW